MAADKAALQEAAAAAATAHEAAIGRLRAELAAQRVRPSTSAVAMFYSLAWSCGTRIMCLHRAVLHILL